LAGSTDPNVWANLLAGMSPAARCSSAWAARGVRNIVVVTPAMAAPLHMFVFDRMNAFGRASAFGPVNVFDRGNACDPSSDDDGVRWGLKIEPGVVPLPPQVPLLRRPSAAFPSCSWSVYG